MHYHILLTELCNSHCRYCYEKSMKEFDNSLKCKFKFDFSSPVSLEINLAKLKQFLLKDKNPVLIFYGGEPLLEIEKIINIIDKLDGTNVKFRMQTNGLLFDKIPIEYLKKIGKILISIDGNQERTDYNRGKGTYDKIMKNIELIRNKGYKGEIIARLTLSDFPDIYNQISFLISTKKFDSYHWQLDAGFYEHDFDYESFRYFSEQYNISIKKLIDLWMNELKKGNSLRLYPFVAIINSLLKDEKTLLRCGAGHSGYTITTKGDIVACPITNSIKDFYAGNLDSKPDNLKKFRIKNQCQKCNYLSICGGRCLYWNYAQLWNETGNQLICNTIKFLIDNLDLMKPKIKKLIEDKTISTSYFDYEKYFGPEIIP